MQVKGDAIEANISVIKRQLTKATYQCCISTIEVAYQRCISAKFLGLCQVKVILASSLRAEHSWWIFVSDLTLLVQ
jgi:hypothetical protein